MEKLRDIVEARKSKELKTLKDIFSVGNEEYKEASYSCGCGSCDEGLFKGCDVVKIRAEAIKWVKNQRSMDGECRKHAANLFEYFFNLTEEDL